MSPVVGYAKLVKPFNESMEFGYYKRTTRQTARWKEMIDERLARCSIVAGGRGRIRGRERYTSTRLFRRVVLRDLLLDNILR